MKIRATIIIHPRGSEEKVNGRAVILLCQDAEREYVYMRGTRGDLQKLLLWGARHWFTLPPDESYFAALRAAVEPAVRPDDPEPLLVASPTCNDAGRPTSEGPMAFALEDESGATVRFDGVSDALFFVIREDGTTARSTGGSGLQKNCLLELGIEALFGADVAERFREGRFDGMPAGVRAMYEDMRRKMRAHAGESLVITDAAAAAMTKGQKPN
ncbi:MAG TPA: hypothetical protein VLC10_01125 [Patescibacteria group bacterium]|nr:hypothetical protein [Patescibacteria group bacterium]